jgi:hypothetical protein
METLLENLHYCNKYIKVNSNRKVISNTKFYVLKQCIIDYILQNAEKLNITIGDCIIQSTKYEQSLVLIPLFYNEKKYEFHQIYENVEFALLAAGASVKYKEDVYEREDKEIEIDIQKFEKSINYIKEYIWTHYKKILANSNLFMDKPVQYINLINLCKKDVVIHFATNGALVNYSTSVILKYKGERVVKSNLITIRKNLRKYLHNIMFEL